MEQEKTTTSKSSTGLDENIGGLLAYLGSFVSGIILIFIEKDNQFIRFHAFQSTFLFGGLAIINLVIGFIPFFGAVAQFLLSPLMVILWIVTMYKAYKGERFKFPIVGDLAEDQLKK
ncbi:DUF4870 domain-containing protein [Salipaludibacillus sp. HK11]|uniref:DUF4870 domain-containing protein n=1 Tax=Salipaludibacillus sp. HK11 TaxID=3394320 RepID=UPI0039FBD4DA